MKGMVSLKSTRRQPWRTGLLLVLCVGLSFVFLSQALQYRAVQNAVNHSATYYHAIGVLRSIGAETVDASRCLPVLEKSDYVDYTNTFEPRYGTMQGVHNVNLDGEDSRNVLYLQGTFQKLTVEYENILHIPYDGEAIFLPRKIAQLTFKITNSFSGHPELLMQEVREFRMDITEHPDFLEVLQKELQPGGSYFFCAIWQKYYYKGNPGFERVRTIVPLGTVTGLPWEMNPSVIMDGIQYRHPLADRKFNDYFYAVSIGRSVDFADPELAASVEALEYVHANECGATIIPVRDMATLPNFEEHYVLSEGRLLSLEDNGQQNPVCVIRQELADKRELEIGDTITLSIKDIESYENGYVFPEFENRFFDAPVTTETYTIVGIIYNLEEDWSTAQHTQIYIPFCFYPDTFRSYVDSGSCSFTLRSPIDKTAFLEEMSGQLRELGFEAEFVDDGWDAFYTSSQAVLQTSCNSMLLMGALLLLGLLLIGFLYQRARRREVAILRTLGIPKGAVLRQTLLPIALLSLCGVGAGGVAAYYYGLKKAREAVEALQAAQPLAVGFNPWEMAALGAAVWLLLVLFQTVFLLGLCTRPVLPLLQGGKVHGKNEKR